MPLMTWNAQFDIGVEDMNREHRDILDAINAVFDATENGQSGPTMMRLIGRLGQITAHHFADEEQFMERTGYPDLATHKVIHQKLLSDFAKHSAAIDAARGVPTPAFFSFLRLWLTAHIKVIDRKYGVHAQHMA